jgi:hypothetical protein
MKVLNIENYRENFISPEAYRQFLAALRDAGGEARLIIDGDEVVGSFVSPEEARARIANRVIRRIAENPKMIDKLRERMSSDDLVD